jgi:hypothetical protein
MKKIILAALCIALCAGSACALPISFGLKAGLSFADFSGTDSSAWAQKVTDDSSGAIQSKAGFVGGGFLSVGAGGSWTIQPEALYVMKGSKYSSTNVSGNVNLNYFEIPVLLKLNLLPVKAPVSPFIFAGPSFSVITSAERTGPNGTLDIKSHVNSSDYGFVFGAGLDNSKFSLDARYDVGLQTPLKSMGTFTPKIHNGTLMVMAGYRFF